MQTFVDNYKAANVKILETCQNISELLLMKIDNKKIYENLEFHADQVQESFLNQKFALVTVLLIILSLFTLILQ